MNKLILTLVAVALVGCTPEDSDDGTAQAGSSSFDGGCIPRSYEEMSIYGFGCADTVGSNISGSGSNTGSGTSTGTPPATSHSASIARYSEYEPNDVPENANPVSFPIVSGDTFPGIEITGAVADISDASDFFIFSPNRSGEYVIYLCAETCTEHPTDAMVAIQVIDQSGTVIAGNPLYEESTKIVTARLDAGLPYYVQIFGFYTAGLQYEYRLVIID